jgi:hypothetical protein
MLVGRKFVDTPDDGWVCDKVVAYECDRLDQLVVFEGELLPLLDVCTFTPIEDILLGHTISMPRLESGGLGLESGLGPENGLEKNEIQGGVKCSLHRLFLIF